jgi:ketosteroid isomerase-like protein
MDEHPALGVARRYFDVYATGDHDAIGACLTDDVVWVIHVELTGS